MNPKKWFTSKTLWVNAAVAVAGVFLEAAPEGVEWVAFANLMLRWFTSRPVEV